MTLTPFRGRCHTCGHDHDAEGQSLRDVLDTHYAAKQEALAEVEQFREDAERYRFLRQDFSPMGLDITGNHAWAYRRNATLKGPNLDAAIDAARKGT